MFLAVLFVLGVPALVIQLLTPAPVSNITYAGIVEHMRAANGTLTDAQLNALAESYYGKRVRWSGWVFDVKQNGEVWVDLDDPTKGFSVQEVYLTLPKGTALGLNKHQPINFEGVIRRVGSVLGKYYVVVGDGVLQ